MGAKDACGMTAVGRSDPPRPFSPKDPMARQDSLPPNLSPRGLSRETAAAYVGVSPVTFDVMVGDGRMPPPKQINARLVWDIRAVDVAFDRLPEKAIGRQSVREVML